MRTKAPRSSLWLRGSTKSAASPATSGSDDTLEVITGYPRRHRLCHRKPEPLVKRRIHEHIGSGGQWRQIRLRDIPQVPHEPEPRHRGLRPPAHRSDDHQLVLVAQRGGQRFEGIQQQIDILPRLNRAHEQHKRPLQTVTHSHFVHQGRRRIEEAVRYAGVYGADFLRRDSQFAYRVLARALRYRDQPVGAARQPSRISPPPPDSQVDVVRASETRSDRVLWPSIARAWAGCVPIRWRGRRPRPASANPAIAVRTGWRSPVPPNRPTSAAGPQPKLRGSTGERAPSTGKCPQRRRRRRASDAGSSDRDSS